MDHITKIVFEPGEYTKILEGMNISQWDQGRKLQFDGLDVEKEIEVHFSLSETGGTAPRVPAEIKEGSVYADIPAFITENEGACGYGCYMAYAFVYLFDGDAAVTVHKAAFKVRMRPKPDDYVSAGDKDVIQVLREGIAQKVDISGHEPDKYLGTDKEGNVVTREVPKALPASDVYDWAKQPEKPVYTADEVGALPASTKIPSSPADIQAEPSGAAETKVTEHNVSKNSHNDIRLMIRDLFDALHAFLDTDDETMNQATEMIAYMKDNRELIEQITTGKVSTSDIVDDYVTNVSNKPVSAAVAVKLKSLIDAITIPTKTSQLENDSGFLTEKPSYTADEVGADRSGTAETRVSEHNTAADAHNDIRILITGLTNRLNVIADSDDTTLDQMSELVAYIKSNKSLIDAVTTSKVNVADIVDDLTTNVSNRPLSAAQGVVLKALIDTIVVPTKTSHLENDSGFLTQHQDLSGYAKKATTLAGYGITDGATKEQVNQLSEEIAELIDDEIPDFWESSVNSVIAIIKALQKDGGRDCITFSFFSDNHQRLGYSGILIKKVMDECNIPFCFYGGDSISSGYIADEATMVEQDRKFDSIMSVIPNGRFKRAVGNHDGYYAVSSSEKHYYTRAQVYDLFLREEAIAQNMNFGDDGTYYYVDDLASKVRFIVLNTNIQRDSDGNTVGSTIDDTQLIWLQNVALKFNESGWVVVFISHQPISNHYHSSITNVSAVRTIVTDYINGTDEYKADVVGWFSGHIHRDRIYTGIATNTSDDTEGDAMGFTQVTITSDHTGAAYDDATKHTVAEDNLSHAIDFVTINKITKLVNLTRLGIGNNRVYSYEREVQTVYYVITRNLTNCTSDKSDTSVEEGSSRAETFTANSGYTLEGATVSVTMGGVDISSNYSNGTLTVDSVTGDIVITISAVAVEENSDYITDATAYRLNSGAWSTTNFGEKDDNNVYATTGFRKDMIVGFTNDKLQALSAGTYVYSGEFKQSESNTSGIAIYNGATRLLKNSLNVGDVWTEFSYEFTIDAVGEIYFCAQNDDSGIAYLRNVSIKLKE